ncbi:hypothetical protein [Ruminiclostridium josui]|uniref:hypothetical protein n=1 Tax=Ruminiclostridium josui TaxID=1499 RepID=UPI0004656A28|nr:hypothetical protein [Ruminiclostridium josui]
MNKDRPIIITIIADLIILWSMFAIGATIFPGYFKKLGFEINPLPIYSNSVTIILLSLVRITAAAGLLLLKKWGYRLMIIYTIFFMVVDVVLCLQKGKVPLTSGMIISFLMISNIIHYKERFD